MTIKELPVITIEREYAAGGRSIAKRLAESLDIPWYDYDFIIQTAINSGLNVEDIVNDSEDLSDSEKLWDSILSTSYLYSSMHDKVFYAQRDVIIKLAQSPCIIVGRAADAICREAAIDAFNVFLYSDEDHKRQHALTLHDCDNPNHIDKYIEKRDKARKNFYKTYTKKEFDDPHNYDICLNTSIGFEICAEILSSAILHRQNRKMK